MAREPKVKTKVSQPKAAPQQNAPVAPKTANTSVDGQVKPIWPTWPTSKPGPFKTPPPAGMRPVNAIRPEQVTEIAYNQETGTPNKR